MIVVASSPVSYLLSPTEETEGKRGGSKCRRIRHGGRIIAEPPNFFVTLNHPRDPFCLILSSPLEVLKTRLPKNET